MSFKKNIKIYYIYSIFSELIILGPIIVLFYITKGLSFTEIMLLQSVDAISTVVFEVLTGAFADKYGRKICLILGAICCGTGLILYVLFNNFIIFIIGEILYGLGTSFKSGADSALIYDSLKAEGREEEYAKVEGKARGITFYAQAFGCIIAGFLYLININLPIIVSVIFMIITAIITMFFYEPQIENKTSVKIKDYYNQILESGMYIIKHEKIKAIIVYYMIFFVFYRVSFWYYQPYMQAVNIPVEYFGLIFFAFNICAAITSHYSHKIMQLTKSRTLTLISGIMIISFLTIGITTIWIGVFAIMLQQVARGLNKPVIAKYINRHTPSDKRATILSFQSLAGNLTFAIASPFLGMLKDKNDIYTTHIILAILMIILTYMSIIYMNKRMGTKVKKEMVIEEGII